MNLKNKTYSHLSAKGADVKYICIMKKIVIILVVLLTTTTIMAQIKVAMNGNVGIGANYPSNGKLTIAYNGSEFAFHASGKTDGKSYFGAHNCVNDPWINFFHPQEGYNKVRFKQSILSSDSTLKTEITPLGNATSILKQIKTYSYYFKSDSIYVTSTFDGVETNYIDLRKKEYGVLAQEVKEILPSLVDTCNEEMFVNYNAFIAILIKGFNEQQALIEQQQTKIEILQNTVVAQEKDIIELKTLQKTMVELQDMVANCCNKSKNGSIQMPNGVKHTQPVQEKAILYQNTPNPFSSNTEITCSLPVNTQQAVIYIYNMEGAELKAYPLTQTGFNTITLLGSELSAGMYLYTLVVDNEIIDTKRMILTK